MSLLTDLQGIQSKINSLKSNKVTRLAYDQTAYTNNIVESPAEYSWSNHNNIPESTLEAMKITEEQRERGFRLRFPILPKLFVDHFFGRVSYNLNKVTDFMYNFVTSVINALGAGNGLATLDNNGRIPSAQTTEALMSYQGGWSASTNTPHLANGSGTQGDVYLCSDDGIVNFGAGNIQFYENDRVVYNGLIWQRVPAGSVKTVSDVQPSLNGNVDLTTQTDVTKILNQRVLNGLFWWQE